MARGALGVLAGMAVALRNTAFRLVNDTWLEPYARQVYEVLWPSQANRYDRETERVLKRVLRPDSTCVDVGCYRGQILKKMIRFAPNGTMHAFDALPESCAYMRQHYPAAIVHEMALSDTAGRSTFCHVVERPGRSGLKRQEYPDPDTEVKEITVEVDRLDNVIPRDNVVDLIKIDVEGAELQVLRGARELIRQHRPVILFEHGVQMASVFAATPEGLYDFLNDECDLKVNLMERWLRNDPALSREAFCKLLYDRIEFFFIAYPEATGS